MSVEVRLRKGETLDKALRRLKKKLDREDILRGARAKRYFEKPCEQRRRKEKVAKFNNMLRLRYENA
jgi:small subunit ribosomal protein S21